MCGTTTATLQNTEAMTMLNEFYAQIGASAIKCVDPFSLVLMLCATAAKIINGNLAMEAFKTIQLLKLNYEDISFPGILPFIEGFLLLPAKHMDGGDKQMCSQLLRDLSMR